MFSKTFHLSQLLDIVKESRNATANKHINFTFISFFTITQLIGLFLLFQKSTSYSNMHIFYLDFVILLGLCYMQANVRGNFKENLKNRSIFNKSFLSYAGTMSLFGGISLMFIVWMLRKTKFYKSPYQISKLKNFSPNTHFFYDPFVIFIFLNILNIVFIVLNNSKFIRKLSNLSFILYMSFLVFMTMNLLFVNEIWKGKIALFLINTFRIPSLYGFEFLTVFFSLIFIILFFVIKWVEKKYIRDYVKNYHKRKIP